MHADNPLCDYFRCPGSFVRLDTGGELSSQPGYFAFHDAVCYGRLANGEPATEPTGRLVDASAATEIAHDRLRLPFDLAEVVGNLRHERYHQNGYRFLDRLTSGPAAEQVYYYFRPMLRVGIRKHLQKIRLSGWEHISFPRWPVEVSVDTLMRRTLGLVIQQNGGGPVPFVWFWPDGAECAVMMTHDAETAAGHAFCERLCELDDTHGIKSAFQLIPGAQEDAFRTTAERLRRRGFEVNLHDLNHDGHLFRDREEFLNRAKQINRYASEFQCGGFRSGAMYRQQSWYEAFEFSYDMSVPNVAHLEPQRGGCCTVMPYFIGDILELPLTTIQDYSLFHILNDYSIALWRQQIEAIRAQNGLVTFLTHPDYLLEPRACAVYVELLGFLRRLRAEKNVWVALPGEIDSWWRSRHSMSVVADGDSWRIEGPHAHRARLAYATLDGDQVRYVLGEAA